MFKSPSGSHFIDVAQEKMSTKSYDDICAEASSAAESRLLEHFKLFGGEVWTIGTGCENCRTRLDDTSALKKCSLCNAALFCSKDCLKSAWRNHKNECGVITAFRKHDGSAADSALLASLLTTLGWSTDETKSCAEPKVVGVATSLQMDVTTLPGWFCSVDFELESKARQAELYDAALTLYALLRDEESWTRDKESFPRSSYTHVEAIPHVNTTQPAVVEQLLELKGHLLLFSNWLQHPEPPATQSVPLEDRGFYGVIDSILQIAAIRDGVDNFMDSR